MRGTEERKKKLETGLLVGGVVLKNSRDKGAGERSSVVNLGGNPLGRMLRVENLTREGVGD